MDIKRRAARGIAVLAVALAAGHLVQNMSAAPAPKPVASAELAKKPVKVETVAAGPETAPAAVDQVAPTAPPAPATLSVAAPPVASAAASDAPVTEPTTTIAALGPTLSLIHI